MYEVYGTKSCIYCKQAVSLLETKKLNYKYFDLNDVSSDVQKQLINVAGHQFRTVPQIFTEQHDDRFENKRVRKRTYIGGYNDLRKHLGV